MGQVVSVDDAIRYLEGAGQHGYAASVRALVDKADQIGQVQIGFDALTPRQTEVYGLLIAGMTNKAIAHTMGVTEACVKAHVMPIFKAFGVTSRAMLIAQHYEREGKHGQANA